MLLLEHVQSTRSYAHEVLRDDKENSAFEGERERVVGGRENQSSGTIAKKREGGS